MPMVGDGGSFQSDFEDDSSDDFVAPVFKKTRRAVASKKKELRCAETKKRLAKSSTY